MGFRASFLVQVLPLQAQVTPPFIDTRVRPAGSVSVTITVPDVAPIPVFDTVSVYVALV